MNFRIFFTMTKTLSHSQIKLNSKFKTTDEISVHLKSYRYPYVQKAEVQKQIIKMLQDGNNKTFAIPLEFTNMDSPKKLDASGNQKWRIVAVTDLLMITY